MAKITVKGQVTIPKKIRKMLGIESGDWIIFSVEGGKAMIYPVKGTLLELKGSLKPKKVPENLDEVREEVKRNIAGRVIYNACWARDRGIPDIYTFDRRHCRRLRGITARIPGEERERG